MRHPSKRRLAATLGLLLLAAAIAAAQSAPASKRINPPQVAKADVAKDAPANDVPVAAPKPAPVKYTELKKTPWPPKTGVKTPGVQIPITNLKPEAEIPLSASPGAFLFTTDQVLIPIPSQDQIARVEAKSNKVLEPISGVTKPCGGAASAFRNLWVVSCGSQSLARLETATGKPVASIGTGAGTASSAVASSPDSVWMLSDDKTTLTRIDPEKNSIVSEFRLAAACRSITSADNSLWVTCPGEKRIIRFNPQTNLVITRIEVTPEPVSMAFGGETPERSGCCLGRKARSRESIPRPTKSSPRLTLDSRTRMAIWPLATDSSG